MKMWSTFIYICTLVCCLFIISVTSKSLLPSYWSKEVAMKKKSVEKACVPFCKVFSTVCNYGECRQKLETDCEWYCECPPDCVGRFCEKLIKPEDSSSTSNPNGFTTNAYMTSIKEITKESNKGNDSKVAKLSTCPPEINNTRLNSTMEKNLTSDNIKNATESGQYSSNDEMNTKTVPTRLTLTTINMVSDTTPAQPVNNATMQQLLPTTVNPVSSNEHTTGRYSTLSGSTLLERTVLSSAEKSTRHTNDVPSVNKISTETSILISILNDSLDVRSFIINSTSSKSTASTARPVTTPSHVTNSTRHDFNESDMDTSKKKEESAITQQTVAVVTAEQKQVPSDADFARNDLNTSSNKTFMSTEERDAVTISIAKFKGNVPTEQSNLAEHTPQAEQTKQLRETSNERTSSPILSTNMPHQLSLAHITTEPKASDQATGRSSINLSISQETTTVKKDEINSSDIEMRTIKVNFNLTMGTSEYSSTHSMKILHTDAFPNTTPLVKTLETVVDQPISNSGTRSVEFKVMLGENKIDTGESMEDQNNIDNTTFNMMSPSFVSTASANHSDKINKSNADTTTAMTTTTTTTTTATPKTVTDAFMRKYIMTTVDRKLKSNENSENFNMATGNNVGNDFMLSLKDIKPESNSLAQSKIYVSQELLDTEKE